MSSDENESDCTDSDDDDDDDDDDDADDDNDNTPVSHRTRERLNSLNSSSENKVTCATDSLSDERDDERTSEFSSDNDKNDKNDDVGRPTPSERHHKQRSLAEFTITLPNGNTCESRFPLQIGKPSLRNVVGDYGVFTQSRIEPKTKICEWTGGRKMTAADFKKQFRNDWRYVYKGRHGRGGGTTLHIVNKVYV